MHDNVINSHKQYNLSNLEPQFKRYLAAVNKLSSVSVKNYLSDYRYFVGWFNTHADDLSLSLQGSSAIELLSGIDENVIESYKDYLISENLPFRTVNRRLSSLRKFFSFAVSQQWVSSNPAKQVTNVPKKITKGHTGSLSTVDVLVSSFVSDLTSEGLDAQYISHAEKDIYEFFAIINS